MSEAESRAREWTSENRSDVDTLFLLHSPEKQRELLIALLASFGASEYRRGLERGAEIAESEEIMLPIDDWLGTKKDFSVKVAQGVAAAIRSSIPGGQG